ncbi:Membrane-spanning 4-domains subfamily A member 12 [Bagarius yarrelli]|uniref:Membrane-spanning 4-domains subfamily A member 12 n=1 Tax=Bagarius yarrelli TaxID=175774 RepID=A0A556TLS1_BAGYA|nr:Membrane-spanning 4-domains subfamily A member 12 [Bagarius yarrelli]
MSLSISEAEGVTVFTVYSNQKSKWPLLCQILGTMCYSPVCSVSSRLKQQLSSALTALAAIQIMVGIMNLGIGSLTLAIYNISDLYATPLWLGGVIIAIGIMCILAEKFPSPCLVVLTVLMNIVSSALAITNIVLYSVDLARGPMYNRCQFPDRQQDVYSWTTASPSKKAMQDKIYEEKLKDYRSCQANSLIMQKILGGLDIMMIMLAVLHLCVTISWCVLNIKVLRKKQAKAKDMEDSELCKPLMEQENPDPVC